MELIITASIRAKEYEPLEREIPLRILTSSANRCLQGLGVSIKSSANISDAVLQKGYLTSPGGAARVIFLLQLRKEQAILVMLRMKNDKQIGANMTVKNPRFKKELNRNIDFILSDLASGHFERHTV